MLCKIKKTKKWWGTSKKFKASAILATFLVMMIILTIALSLALVTIKDMKGSIGSSKSNLAYQASDEGIEDVMFAILKNGYDKVNQIMPAECDGTDGLIKANNYIVELLDDATPNARINCNTDTDIMTVKNIKSIGTSQDNVQKSERAIVVPVSCPIAYTIDAGDDDTVGLWHFDETAGTAAYLKDTSENHNDGTPSATGTSVARGICVARSFDGNQGYIGLGDSDTLQPTSNLTAELWFKTSTNSGSMLLRKRLFGYGIEMGNYVSGSTAGHITFWIYDAANVIYKVTSPNTYNDDGWHYASGVYDGSSVELYVDGKSVASKVSAGTIGYSPGGVSIGRDGDTSAGYFDGIIDEVLISKKAKDEGEIQADFCKGCEKVFPQPSNCSTDCP